MTTFTLLTVRNAVLAELVRGALEAEGVPVRLERDALAVVYGLDVGRWATRVLVPNDEFERARKLLEEIEAEA